MKDNCLFRIRIRLRLLRKKILCNIAKCKDFSFQKGGQVCWLIGTPDHRNLGDHAIAVATKMFLADHLKDFSVFEITEGEFYSGIKTMIKHSNAGDLIVLQGGGNLGNLYPYIEDMRRIVIDWFPKNQIILFPQTFNFTNNQRGDYEKKITIQKYNRHQSLCLFAREYTSYLIMKQLFREVYCVPDIVLYMNKKLIVKKSQKKNLVLCCFRNDKESLLTIDQKNKIVHSILSAGYQCHNIDTIADEMVTKEKREGALDKLLTAFSDAMWIITDRLHGMIFSEIVQTPCVVFPSLDHKVMGVYQWIKNDPNIIFCESERDWSVNALSRRINNDLVDLNDKYLPLIEKVEMQWKK